MANFNKPNESNKKNIGMIIITLCFALAGLACIIIGFGNEMLTWLATFGIVIVVLASPLLIFFLYTILSKKIKDM